MSFLRHTRIPWLICGKFVVQQSILWSDWTAMINPTNNGVITEKRTRFVCSMGLSQDEQVPQIKTDSVVYRMCQNQERTDCQETGSSSNNLSHKSFQYLFRFFLE